MTASGDLAAAIRAAAVTPAAAVDAYCAALDAMRRAVDGWETRKEWASFAFTALRAADPALSEPAAIELTGAYLRLSAPTVAHAVYARLPKRTPPGWQADRVIGRFLVETMNGLRRDMEEAVAVVDETHQAAAAAMLGFYDAVTAAVAAAAAAGLSSRRLCRVTRMPGSTVLAMARRPAGERLSERFLGWVAGSRPGTVSEADLELLGERLAKMGVGPQAARAAGKLLRALELFAVAGPRYVGDAAERQQCVSTEIEIIRTAPARHPAEFWRSLTPGSG